MVKKYYGQKPEIIKRLKIEFKEMVFYQYLPIKMNGMTGFNLEERLQPFCDLITECSIDYNNCFGAEQFKEAYVYLTVKRQYISKEKSMNRPGYHSDGFLTNDINYIWCDVNPTIFNKSKFNLTLDDEISLLEMEKQANPENDFHHAANTILRLDQFNIHKVNDLSNYEGMRTFAKVSFSKDKYNLEGNSHNYQIDYDWEMKPRKKQRNIPQILKLKK